MRLEHFTKLDLAAIRAHRSAIERTTAAIVSVGALTLGGLACGGGTPSPAAPDPAAQASAAPAGSGNPAAEPSGEAKTAAPETPAKPPPQDIVLEKPTRPVRSILESADTVYFVSYEESDVGKTAETNCGKESGGDPQKNSACMSKARQNVEGLGYRFKKNPKGEVTTCTILRRQGNTLVTLHKFKYKYGDETETSIVIKMDGKDDGPIKWEKVPPEFKLEVPNDYTMIVQDPKYGRLVYYAKAGIPGD
jgi:hypothetical protein